MQLIKSFQPIVIFEKISIVNVLQSPNTRLFIKHLLHFDLQRETSVRNRSLMEFPLILKENFQDFIIYIYIYI